jgi:hypothetical protein
VAASKVSKLENGRQTPTDDDIRGWARATNSEVKLRRCWRRCTLSKCSTPSGSGSSGPASSPTNRRLPSWTPRLGCSARSNRRSLAAVANYGRAARVIINRVIDDLASEAPEDGE